MVVKPPKPSNEDISLLLALYRPGSVVPGLKLFEDHKRLARERDLPWSSRNALGRALSRAGATRRLVRRWRGPRGKQRIIDTHCWVLPGAPPVDEEDGRMALVLRRLLAGDRMAYIPVTAIWAEYAELALTEGWAWSMARSQVSAWLNRRGFIKSIHHGVPCRYVDAHKVDRISGVPVPRAEPARQRPPVDNEFVAADEL